MLLFSSSPLLFVRKRESEFIGVGRKLLLLLLLFLFSSLSFPFVRRENEKAKFIGGGSKAGQALALSTRPKGEGCRHTVSVNNCNGKRKYRDRVGRSKTKFEHIENTGANQS